MSDVPSQEIIYVGDPMCSWCWGFAPVAEALAERFADTAPLRLVLGGLRPGARAERLDERLKATIRPHWERVEKLTGQPFDYSLFDRDDFLFDTEPASRAVVYARGQDPARALPVFFALERAFYRDSVDITQLEGLASVLAQLGFDAERFKAEFDEPSLKQQTYADFTMAGRLGAQGFPTVIVRKRDQLGLLTVGYQPLDVVLPATERFFG